MKTSAIALIAAVALVLVVQPVAASNKQGQVYLKENGAKEGVTTLPSGLQYRVMKSGNGKPVPNAHTPCECHYKGTLIDGTEFDSSYSRGKPATFAPNQVIKGWTEAMQLMREGDQWELVIPSELAYGESARGKYIRAGDVLVFTLEIMKVNK
mmetsp:Transcript_38607/g.46719  ORF Transcript_38607/g.46719 Transcript_38607/m.46719 type:complete len:153 (-) Transcript_38607:242-700(-)|eukprot:CAMPEP_0197847132 /NCGR_PEP_ID=MMETSP1438-20131217/5248_1 /TAXON_ID=1461541 /ORGANISM="Pterosperma sp., Strain CCMP1384" /LENGTH=152 /DNA_ID=CAMNT_0043458963 /DNA_START=73 /DNA_END=531 /DNA_ORIENTATION=+